jgi:hypothetical protein
VRPQALQVRRERRVGTEQRLDTHGRRHVGVAQQPAQIVAGEHQHPEHAVGAVDQREPLLLGQDDRLDPGGGQRVGGGPQHPVGVAHLALTGQGQRAVRERREVPRATQRPVLRHHRGDPGVEYGRVRTGGLRPDAGPPGRERREPQQHQRAHHLPLDLRARARGVRADQAALQLRAPVARNVPGGQRAEAGGHAVVRVDVAGERVDHPAAVLDPGLRLRGQDGPGPVPGHGEDVGGGQRPDADGDGVPVARYRARRAARTAHLVGLHGPYGTPRGVVLTMPRRPSPSGVSGTVQLRRRRRVPARR